MPSKFTKIIRDREYAEHKRRIKEMKSSIDNKKPREMPLSQRQEIERKRQQTLIEMDNRLLLDRLGVALSIKNIDNEPVKNTFVSLGENARKKELLKIQMDNRRLLERIQTTVPAYNHIEWERDAHHRAAYLKNMTNFPQYFRPPDTTADERRRNKLSPDDEIFNPEPPVSVMHKDFDCTKGHEDRRSIRPNSSSYLEPVNQSRGSHNSKGGY